MQIIAPCESLVKYLYGGGTTAAGPEECVGKRKERLARLGVVHHALRRPASQERDGRVEFAARDLECISRCPCFRNTGFISSSRPETLPLFPPTTRPLLHLSLDPKIIVTPSHPSHTALDHRAITVALTIKQSPAEAI